LSTSCKSISWNGRESVAVGSGTSNVVTSVDGVTWNAVSTTGITTGYGVEWNGRQWIISSSGSSPLKVAFDSSVAGTMNVFDASASFTLLNGGGVGYCVGANSGVGATVFNSRMYLNAGDKLVVGGPEHYDSSLMPDTSISINMNLPV
jgi:hypothetical protein